MAIFFLLFHGNLYRMKNTIFVDTSWMGVRSRNREHEMGNLKDRVCFAVSVFVLQSVVYALPTLGRTESVYATPDMACVARRACSAVVCADSSWSVPWVGNISDVKESRADINGRGEDVTASFPISPTGAAMAEMGFLCISLIFNRRQWLALIAFPLVLLSITLHYLPHICRHSGVASARFASEHFDHSLFSVFSSHLPLIKRARGFSRSVHGDAILGNFASRGISSKTVFFSHSSINEPLAVAVQGLSGRSPPGIC